MDNPSTLDPETGHCSKKPRLEEVSPQQAGKPLIQTQEEVAGENPTKPQSVDAESSGQDPGDKSQYVLTEKDIGMTEYISSHKGFSGVIKQRFSDFLVNEIQLDGQTVKLTDISEPQCDVVQEEVSTSVLKDDWTKQLDEFQGQENKDKHIYIGSNDCADKETRSQIHKAIKAKYPNLDTSTEDRDGAKVIKVIHSSNKDRKARQSWPAGRGDYCRFVLYKENKDTMEAADLLSKFLRHNTPRMKPGAFTYAGTKDRRAKTCQLLAVYRVEAAKLHALNKKLRGIALGNFSYCKEPLKLGDLKGNHFNIILRNVQGSTEQIQQAMSSLGDVGFINYYGMQRFGTTSVPTHQVGRALLKTNWQEAVELILKPRENDKTAIEKARSTWWETRDSKQALRKLGGTHCIEKHLLTGLSKHSKNDLVGALNCIPRNSRLMYVHAYQSYIWNTMVSKRLRETGMKPVPGDLVLKADSAVEDPADTEAAGTSDNSKSQRPEPLPLTSDNVGQYSIHDLVLPLPGHDVKYPGNECKQWYEDILAEDGLGLDSFKNKVKDYSLPGSYRKVLVKPGDLSWNQFTYNDVTIPLVRSDLEILNDVQLEMPPTDGKFHALQLEFSLPSSSYATMAIRDVLKCDTSAAHQTTLNVT